MEGNVEIRILLIGKSGSGKSTTGNNILDSKVFTSSSGIASLANKCQLSKTLRFGRMITVVDTPGLCHTRITNENILNELTNCTGMISPGPHAVVFVTRIGKFTYEDKVTIQTYASHFGEDVFSYMFILFTRKNDLRESIEEFIDRSDPALQALVQKCSNRYIAFENNSDSVSKEKQCIELMVSINKMLVENGGHFFTTERLLEAENILLKKQMRRAQENEEKKTAEMNKRKQRKRSKTIRILLIGKSGSGQSTTGNNILNSKVFASGYGSESITNKCQLSKALRFGRMIRVVDTPGLWHTRIPNETILNELTKFTGMISPGPHAIAFVIKVCRFTKEDQVTIQKYVNYFGEHVFSYMFILFTRKDELSGSIEEFIDESDPALQALVQKCSNRYIAFENRSDSVSNEIQCIELMVLIDKMIEENGGHFFTTEMLLEAENILLKKQMRMAQEEEEKRNEEINRRKQKERIKTTRILLIGKSGSGKSCIGNNILNSNVFTSASSFESVTEKCKESKALRFGRMITVVDTPGLWHTLITNENILNELTKYKGMISTGPHAVGFVLRIGRFVEEDKSTIRMYVNHFGECVFSNMIILFTGAGELEDCDCSIEEYIDRSDPCLKALVHKCYNRYIAFENKSDSESKEQDCKKLILLIDGMLVESV